MAIASTFGFMVGVGITCFKNGLQYLPAYRCVRCASCCLTPFAGLAPQNPAAAESAAQEQEQQQALLLLKDGALCSSVSLQQLPMSCHYVHLSACWICALPLPVCVCLQEALGACNCWNGNGVLVPVDC